MLDRILQDLGCEGNSRIILPGDARFADAAKSSRYVVSDNPATGKPLAAVSLDDAASYSRTIDASVKVYESWRLVTAPERGQVVRAIGEEFRRLKEPLGMLITLEAGKIIAEGQGEVQEVVDIADFAVGLSRQLYGLTMPSERPNHRMLEQWHPLGIVGVITAFNFPCAVWGWNSILAAVCGNVTLWKPSLLTPLVAIATQQIADRVATKLGYPGLFPLVIGTDADVGETMIADKRLPLISATGSCRMGKRVAGVVGARLGRTLLELGGNNAVIVDPTADLDLATQAITFAAVGTAGQRCTTTRRLIVHESRVDELVKKLVAAYQSINATRIGDPSQAGTLIGPVINARAVEGYSHAVAQAKQQGGTVLIGGKVASPAGLGGTFVEPTIIRAPANNQLPISREETFAPILYVFTYQELDEAIALQNGVDQGLSSAIFSDSVRAAERFLSAAGSDCGIANVNIGTSGAEIGGAFGGEKETGGGRESGSDSWRAYMRRQTVTIHYGVGLTLAQGITFG
jgi:aldehyde dehydrogenase (NAD+)